MDLTILWWILAVLLVVGGLVGTVVPALPGVPIVFAGLFLAAIIFLPRVALAGLFGVLILAGGWEWSRLAGWHSAVSRGGFVIVLTGITSWPSDARSGQASVFIQRARSNTMIFGTSLRTASPPAMSPYRVQ